MTKKTVTGVAFAALCLAAFAGSPSARADQLITNGPQADRGDFRGNWSAQRNNIESQQYDRLVASNPGFRAARMRRECGPITDPQLRSDCMASFREFEPGYGSSGPRLHRHHDLEEMGQ